MLQLFLNIRPFSPLGPLGEANCHATAEWEVISELSRICLDIDGRERVIGKVVGKGRARNERAAAAAAVEGGVKEANDYWGGRCGLNLEGR